MDSEQQWRRLLEIIDGARERSAEAASAHESASAQLDVAEYDLRQIAAALVEILGTSLPATAPSADPSAPLMPIPLRATGS